MNVEELIALNNNAKDFLSKIDSSLSTRTLVVNDDQIYVMNMRGELTLVNRQVLVNRLKQCHYYIANPDKFKEL